MITFENVTKHYNTNVGLENASVHIHKGDFVFLVGPSGAGKSTFIKLILKEIDADSGSIKVAGREVTTMSNREVPELRRRIGIVFQDFRLLPKKTVYENVAFAMEILHKSKRQIRKKVPQVLSLVGISDKADKYPDELSAGEQQRVAIARAIINNPTVLIADEPTGNLDPDTANEIMDLLNQINLTGTTIVMVTHAKDIVDRMKKRVVAIEGGRIVRDEFGQYGFEEEGTAENIFEPESDRASKPARKLSARQAKRAAREAELLDADIEEQPVEAAAGIELDMEAAAAAGIATEEALHIAAASEETMHAAAESETAAESVEAAPEASSLSEPFVPSAPFEDEDESAAAEDFMPSETAETADPAATDLDAADLAGLDLDAAQTEPETEAAAYDQTAAVTEEEPLAEAALDAGMLARATIEIKAERLNEAIAEAEASAAEEEAVDHE